MEKPENQKERNLIKGAIRRVFSRSELRRSVVDRAEVQHIDPDRPRVKKWVVCNQCKFKTPKYQAEVDHIMPIVPINAPLEQISWTALVNTVWCSFDNLQVLCKTCHNVKSKEENKLRRLYRKGLK